VQLQLIDLHGAGLALLRVQSEQLAQRANLHLVLGGSFEIPPEPADEGTSQSTTPPPAAR
jgi:hypothetical protein